MEVGAEIGEEEVGEDVGSRRLVGPSLGSHLEGRRGNFDWRGPDEDRSCNQVRLFGCDRHNSDRRGGIVLGFNPHFGKSSL